MHYTAYFSYDVNTDKLFCIPCYCTHILAYLSYTFLVSKCICVPTLELPGGIFKFSLNIILQNFLKQWWEMLKKLPLTFNSRTFAFKPHQLIRKTPCPSYFPQQWYWHTKSLHKSFISISWLNKPIQFTTIMAMYLSSHSGYWWFAQRFKS